MEIPRDRADVPSHSPPTVTGFDRVEAERQSFSVVRRAVEKTRLMVDGGAMVSTADVLGKLNAALAEHGKGELGIAISLAQAAAGLYQEKLNRWEGLVRQREELVKQRSVQKFRQLQALHNPIRTNTRQIPASFQHLVGRLEESVKIAKEAGHDARADDRSPFEAEQGAQKIDSSSECDASTAPPPAFDSDILEREGIRALVDLIGEGREMEFSRAKLKPTFKNAAVREQLWQNRSLALVVTWSNGNQLVDLDTALLTLHLWVLPKRIHVMRDLDLLGKHSFVIDNLDDGTSEPVILAPATANSPATPYNADIRNYITAKSKEFRKSSGGKSVFTLYADNVYVNRPFAEAHRHKYVLRLPVPWGSVST